MVKKFWISYQTSYFYIFLFHLFMFRVYSNYSQPLQLTSRKRGIKEFERPMKYLNLILHLILKDSSSLCNTCTVLGLPKSWFWDQLAFLSPNIALSMHCRRCDSRHDYTQDINMHDISSIIIITRMFTRPFLSRTAFLRRPVVKATLF